MSDQFEKRKAAAIADHSAGRLEPAERSYRSLLSERPLDANVLYLLGTLRLQRNDPVEGLKLLDRTVQLAPGFEPAQVNRATVLTHLKRYEAAIRVHDQILLKNQNNAIVWNVRGLALRALDRHAEAAESASRAVALQPTNAEFHFNRAETLGLLQKFNTAFESIVEALRMKPDWAEAHQVQGAILHQLARYEEALASHQRALALSPKLIAALDGMGVAFRALHRPDEALLVHDRVLQFQPTSAEAHSNRGVALLSLARSKEAEASFNAALSFDPNYVDAQYNRALARLQLGDYWNGWADYELRWKTKSFPSKRSKLQAPFWDGSPLNGRTLLVFAEQGRGDIIQFSRLLLWATQQGGPVLFACPPRMMWMFSGLDKGLTLVSNTAPLDEPDVQAALMSLPHLAKISVESVPQALPFTSADPRRVAAARTKWSQTELNVGICWTGSQEMRFSRNRFFPLQHLAPLAEVRGISLVSLQEAKTNAEDRPTIVSLGIQTLGDDADSGSDAFADTAAAILALDLVITADTAVAHLAGSLGKPVWILLTYAPDWRWMLNRTDSPWYPSARLFRQKSPGDWALVVADVAKALTSLVHDKVAILDAKV